MQFNGINSQSFFFILHKTLCTIQCCSDNETHVIVVFASQCINGIRRKIIGSDKKNQFLSIWNWINFHFEERKSFQNKWKITFSTAFHGSVKWTTNNNIEAAFHHWKKFSRALNGKQWLALFLINLSVNSKWVARTLLFDSMHRGREFC